MSGRAAGGGERLSYFEGYRAIGAVVVVIFHAYQHNRDPVTWHWPLEGTTWHDLLRATDLVVDLFFVQSAFLLGRPYLRACLDGERRQHARAFLVRRAARVLPLYYTAILLVWAISNPILPGDWPDLLLHVTFTQTFSQAKIFYTNGPAWSLAVEMQFYLLLAVLGALAQRICGRLRHRSARLAVLLLGIAVLAGACDGYRLLAVSAWRLPDTYWPAWFGLPAKLDVFAAGLLLALLAAGGVRLPGAAARRLVGAAGIAVLVGGSVVRLRPGFPETFVHGVYGAGCALVHGASVLGGSHGPRWARVRWLVALGGMSYSLYLWHEPVLRLLDSHGLLPERGTAAGFGFTAVLLLAVSLPVAWLSYHAVERTGQFVARAFDGEGRRREYYRPLPDLPAPPQIRDVTEVLSLRGRLPAGTWPTRD
ncbi:acyltransferase family protein [Gandjariella thermophila]|uniref:Acyltransferase n=1 Tax=Gandjariella thermophila TaxID=1931992 RepID=A0A4D4JH01_9PSEU|nr:acyltransferase [Gandjariella thermophila]GDY33177.1 acyltransferase [Gandjariella thermophila]